MMALSGVRISWLILARNSDFAVEAFSASLPRVDQLFLGALPGGDVAQHRAEFLAVLDAPDGHEERHQPALPHAADRLAAGVEQARGRCRAPAGRDSRARGGLLSGANRSPSDSSAISPAS